MAAAPHRLPPGLRDSPDALNSRTERERLGKSKRGREDEGHGGSIGRQHTGG